MFILVGEILVFFKVIGIIFSYKFKGKFTSMYFPIFTYKSVSFCGNQKH